MSKHPKSSQQKAVTAVTHYLTDYLSEPDTFRGQLLRGNGPIAEFESNLAEICQFPHCVATANATSALMGLGLIFQIKNKEVLIPESHWEGTAAAFRVLGANIILYSESDTLAEVIKHYPKTRAVIVTQNTPPIQPDPSSTKESPIFIEDSPRLPVLKGSSHSPWDIQVLSFGPGKPLSLGEGGAVLFRSEDLKEKFIRLTQHPERFANEYGEDPTVPHACINGRIHPVAAVLGSHLLKANER